MNCCHIEAIANRIDDHVCSHCVWGLCLRFEYLEVGGRSPPARVLSLAAGGVSLHKAHRNVLERTHIQFAIK